jgi:hypothetical protein
MPATLINSYFVSTNSQNNLTLTTSAFTPAVGEVIIVKATTEGDYCQVGSISGGTGIIWASPIDVTGSGSDPIQVWTTTVATAPGSMTVSVTFTGSTGMHSLIVERWNGRLAPTPAVGWLVGASTGACSITTTGNDSVISWVDSDYNARTGTTTYYQSTTLLASQLASNISAWYGYSPAATPGTYTVGVSAPTGQRSTCAAIEILTPNQTLTATGKSFGAIGQAVVTHADKTLVASGTNFGAIGHATVNPGPVTVAAKGLPSDFVSGRAAVLTGLILQASGTVTGFASGAATVIPGPVTLTATGKPSSFASGFTVLKRIQVVIPNALIPQPKDRTTYELMCVSRIPQQSGPPTFVEIDPIEWNGLSYTQSLNKPDTISVGCSVTSLPPSIKSILIDQAHKASEIWLYRNGKLIFAGPWLGWQVQSQTLTITSKSLASYFDWMIVLQDMVFAQVDQFSIIKQLVDQWQSTPFANFGIDTSDITATSGVLRDATYLKTELDLVSKCVDNMSNNINGFDWAVDPANRKLRLYYPQRGLDRSSGPEAIIFDERNVQNTNIICSSGPKDIASDAFGTGTSTGAASSGVIYSNKFDPDLRQHFGRSAMVRNFPGVSDQTTLDGYTQAMVNGHGNSLLIPGPDARVTVDSDLNSYSVGDTVNYALHSSLGVVGNFRVLGRQIVVSKTGKETVTLSFV